MILPFPLMRAAAALCLAGFVLPGALAHAQGEPDPAEAPPARFVLRNATLVQAPGRSPSKGHIFIEDGWITGVRAPADSLPDLPVVDAAGLFVYPGLILGRPQPTAGSPAPLLLHPAALISAPPPAPAFDAAALRSQGITTLHVTPSDALGPAVGALWSTGENPDVSPVHGARTGLAGSFGAADADETGVMTAFAAWRTLFARFRETQAQGQEDDPAEADAPSGESAGLLAETAAGAQPVFFHAPADLDVHRAFGLSRDLGLRLVLTEVESTNWLPPRRRFRNRPPADLAGVILPLDTGSSSPQAAAAEADGFPAGLLFGDAVLSGSASASAREFGRRNIPFAFSLTGVEPSQMLASMRRLVADGVPERALLAALTTDAASLFGVRNRLGSIDSGMVANLVVTDGPLFASGTRILRVYIAGVPYEVEPLPAEEIPGAVAGEGPYGRWQIEIEGPGGRLTGVLTMRLAEAGPSGTMTMGGDANPMPLEEVALDEAEVRFLVRAATTSGPLTLRVRSSVEADAMTGTAEIGRFGTFPFRATRVSADQPEPRR